MKKFFKIKIFLIVRLICLLLLVSFPHYYLDDFLFWGHSFNTIAFLFFLFLKMGDLMLDDYWGNFESRIPRLLYRFPLTTTNLLIFLFWVVWTVYLIEFGDLQNTEIKKISHCCLIYFLSTILTVIVDYIVSVQKFKVYIDEINLDDTFTEKRLDTLPIFPEPQYYRSSHMSLYIEHDWIVCEKGSNYIKVYNRDFPEQKRSIRTLSELRKLLKGSYFSSKTIVRECELIFKNVQEMYSDKEI